MFSYFNKNKFRSGFTLLEMMIVVAIFLITSGIVLSNFKGFTRASSLDLLAREMSLAIRQAQVYGSATRRYEGDVGGGNLFPSYGAYVPGNSAASFQLFADKDGDSYDDGDDKTNCDRGLSGECVEQFNLTGGAAILKVLGYYPGGPSDGELVTLLNREGINIVFQRPKLGPIFTIKCSSAGDCPDFCLSASGDDPSIKICAYTYVKIILFNPSADSKPFRTPEIFVWNTGHIYVGSELGESESED